MIRLCSGLNSILVFLSIFAIAATFRFTTQDQFNKLCLKTVLELDGTGEDSEDDPSQSFVEEEVVIAGHFTIQPANVRLLAINFVQHINLIPQLYQSDFLRPPSL